MMMDRSSSPTVIPGVKLKPLSLGDVHARVKQDLPVGRQVKRLPPSFLKLQQHHSNKQHQLLDVERESYMTINTRTKKKRGNVASLKLDGNDLRDSNVELSASTTRQLSLGGKRHGPELLERSTPTKAVTLAPLEHDITLLPDKDTIKIVQGKSLLNTPSPRTNRSTLIPNQSMKIFGDTKSSVHSVRAQLCIESLTSGCINAFSEFFALSHREPVLIDPIAEIYFTIPQDELIAIKDLLVKAEELQRNSEFKEVYNIYKQIADYFESERDIETSLYYHMLGQQLAKRSSDTLLEGLAHENIGKVFERLGQTENALKSHEAHLSLADASKDSHEMNKARQQLWSVYIKIAKDIEEEKNFQNACVFYEKALKIAKASNDNDIIAKSYFYLGKIYERLDDFRSSLEHQEQYTKLCEESGDTRGKAQAQCALGQLYERIGKYQSALLTYQRFLETGEQCQDESLISDACQRIGLVLNQLGEYQESVPYFERNFNYALKSGDDDWIGRAKVKLAFAKGNAGMMTHLQELLEKDNFEFPQQQQ